MLKVSINGQEPETAEAIIIYDDDTPVAAATQHGDVVFYCDAVRDTDDLHRVLTSLGLPIKQLALVNQEIVGNIT